MLDNKDLEILQTMMTQIVAASESRMSAKIEESIAASESRIMAYIESDILPRFDKLTNGHEPLVEPLAPKNRIEKLEEEVALLKALVMSMLTDIDKLKKAQ